MYHPANTLGRLPEVPLQQFMPGGRTFLAAPYPVGLSLQNTGFQNAYGWSFGNGTSSDSVMLWSGAAWTNFYFSGSTWLDRSNNPQNGFYLYGGQPTFISRHSSPLPNQSFITRPLPYSP